MNMHYYINVCVCVFCTSPTLAQSQLFSLSLSFLSSLYPGQGLATPSFRHGPWWPFGNISLSGSRLRSASLRQVELSGWGCSRSWPGVLTEVYGWRGSLLIIAGINVHLFVVAMLTRTPGVRVRSTMSSSPSCRSVAEEECEGDVDQLLNPSHHRNDARHDKTICKRIKGCIDSFLDRISISVIFREYPMLKSLPFLSLSVSIMTTGMVVFLVPSAIEKGIDLERATVLSSLFGIGILTGRLSGGLVITKISWKPSTIVCLFYPICAASFVVHATCTSYTVLAINSFINPVCLNVISSTLFFLMEQALPKRLFKGGFFLFALFYGMGSPIGGLLAGKNSRV